MEKVKMQFKIRPAEIKEGKPEDPVRCPFGLAVKARTGEWIDAMASDWVRIAKVGTAELPKDLQEFIAKVDARLPVKPLTVTLLVTPFEEAA